VEQLVEVRPEIEAVRESSRPDMIGSKRRNCIAAFAGRVENMRRKSHPVKMAKILINPV